jgi:hypothetical protein
MKTNIWSHGWKLRSISRAIFKLKPVLICMLFLTSLTGGVALGVEQDLDEEFKTNPRNLRGEAISREALLGSPSVIVITPDLEAAASSRKWMEMLTGELNVSNVQVRQALFLYTEHYASEREMMRQAKRSFPSQQWARTWIVFDLDLFGVVDESDLSDESMVLVLDSSGRIITQVTGPPTVEQFRHIDATLLAATAASAG